MLDIAGDEQNIVNKDWTQYQSDDNQTIFELKSLSSAHNTNTINHAITKDSTPQCPDSKYQYDNQLLSERLRQSKRYSRLNPDAVFQILDERQRYSYEYLKKFAVQRLNEKIGNKLDILQRIYKCEKYVKEPDEMLAHDVFSWSLKDFLKRRQLQDYVWIDVMQRISENCLTVYKFKQDIQQLQIFLRNIFDGVYGGLELKEVDLRESVVQPLR